MPKSTVKENELVKDFLLEKSVELKERATKIFNKKVATQAALNLIQAEEFLNAIKQVFKKGWCTPQKYQGKRNHKKYQRVLNCVISDTHFQSLIDPEECPHEYGPIQESRRLGKVAFETAEYKPQYRKNTKLNILILGDIIQGMLHDPRDGAPLAWQQSAAIHYLTQFVMFLAAQFPSVEVHCASGNHGRNKLRHSDRAVHQKWDSHETVIYYAVKEAVLASGITNVKFNIPKSPYVVIQVFDKKIWAGHGDSALRVGYPSQSINVKSLSHQILKWNEAKNVGGPFDLFVVGHIHTGAQVRLPEGSILTNGCLNPADPYALSIGAPNNACGQWLFESVEGYVLGDSRFIEVNTVDLEAFYNKIITPFSNF